jgi:hypothetical protein
MAKKALERRSNHHPVFRSSPFNPARAYHTTHLVSGGRTIAEPALHENVSANGGKFDSVIDSEINHMIYIQNNYL